MLLHDCKFRISYVTAARTGRITPLKSESYRCRVNPLQRINPLAGHPARAAGPSRERVNPPPTGSTRNRYSPVEAESFRKRDYSASTEAIRHFILPDVVALIEPWLNQPANTFGHWCNYSPLLTLPGKLRALVNKVKAHVARTKRTLLLFSDRENLLPVTLDDHAGCTLCTSSRHTASLRFQNRVRV